MNIPDWKMKRLLDFRILMQAARDEFPEHAFEIDRAIFSVGQKISSCADPYCHCRQETLEKFHARQNEAAAKNEPTASRNRNRSGSASVPEARA